jgi:cation transport ATPase
MLVMVLVTLFAVHLPLSNSVAAHEGSKAIVVFNGLRLLSHRLTLR